MNQPDYNICNQSKEAQERAADDTLACYWLNLKASGQLKRHQVKKKMEELPEVLRERMRAALNRNLPKFKDSHHGA